MGLLKSVKNIPNIDYVDYRETVYYNKYKYRTRISIKGLRYIYYSRNIKMFLNKISSEAKKYHYSPISEYDKKQIIDNQSVFETIIDYRIRFNKENLGTVRIEHDTISFFSNDLNLLLSMKPFITIGTIDYSEALLEAVAGVKYFLREPKTKFRVYLRTKMVPDDTTRDLRDIFKRYPSLKPSYGLKNWISENTPKWKRKSCSSSFHISYNDENMLSFLMLMHSDLIGKIYKLEKRQATT